MTVDLWPGDHESSERYDDNAAMTLDKQPRRQTHEMNDNLPAYRHMHTQSNLTRFCRQENKHVRHSCVLALLHWQWAVNPANAHLLNVTLGFLD